MRIIKVETENGTVAITQNTEKWQLISLKGTNPVVGQHNKSSIVGGNGSIINSTRVDDRQIVMVLALNTPVESHRLELYNLLGTNDTVRFYYKTELVDVYIDGIIESNECDINTSSTLVQITINCPQPFFKSISSVDRGGANFTDFLEFKDGYMQIDQEYIDEEYVGGIEFSTVAFNDTLEIVNDSQLELGMVMTITMLSDIDNFSIINHLNEKFGFNYSFKGGEKIVINTNFGEESVYLVRGDGLVNLLNYITYDSTWMQLKKGNNIFTYGGVGSRYVDVVISYVKEYKGV